MGGFQQANSNSNSNSKNDNHDDDGNDNNNMLRKTWHFTWRQSEVLS